VVDGVWVRGVDMVVIVIGEGGQGGGAKAGEGHVLRGMDDESGGGLAATCTARRAPNGQ
jgi:hypothetical protein